MQSFPAIYRAKVTKINGSSVSALIPQVFGDTSVVISYFLTGIPESVGMGWVAFQGGSPDFPVWMGAGVVTEGEGGGGGEGADEVWISTTEPVDPAIELWYDPDASAPVTPSGSYVHNQTVAAATWVIDHNLGFYPGVRVEDSAGGDVEGDVTHDSTTRMTLVFSATFSGKAYLS